MSKRLRIAFLPQQKKRLIQILKKVRKTKANNQQNNLTEINEQQVILTETNEQQTEINEI
jgi:hypothetical protein